ncbi:ribonuclease Z [Paenibacillus montanisoli]|uniref:Ribonuclease Z n=1 Tax=Paenibacillus montanisoli TaxID=2081970 RepID=A0A328U5T0_9BACL|nr:ribonuclease Z [Paenibacillus montanisoli]RAP78218.1 ribonuclease Z [Paenibacillus montanisoli]
MQLKFLGTSAGRPTKTRNVTSVALCLPEPQCGFWLFDCGEGTQHRLLHSGLKLNKMERIFITHLHGDHLYGLPGLLSSRTYFEGAGPLQVFGPAGLKAYLECIFRYSGVHLGYELDVIEVTPGEISSDHRFVVEAAELEHRLPCYGYRIIERPQLGQLNLAALADMGIRPGPLYGKLKRGEAVTLEDGRTLTPADVVGPSLPGRIVTILGDTKPCDNAVTLAKDADLVVHEATFAGGMEEKAANYGHSTFRQAAEIALAAGAKRLVVTHFSSRFDDAAVQELVADARHIFANTEAAADFAEFPIKRPARE